LIGEIVHNYFRTRGATLTSYELRRLVAELLALQDRGQQDRRHEPLSAEPSLVTFAGEPVSAETAWTGDETGTPGPVVPDVVFEGPPSRLVNVTHHDPDAAVLAEATAQASARLAIDAEERIPRRREPRHRRGARWSSRRSAERGAARLALANSAGWA
jgi:hypothetical protein